TTQPSRLLRKQLANGAKRLIDGNVCVGAGTRIRICNGDPAKWLPPPHPWFFAFLPFRRIKAKWRVGVTMRPSVDGNAIDIGGWIKARATQHAAQLIANVALEFRERRLQKFGASNSILVSDRQSRLAWRPEHEEHRGLLRFAREFIAAKTDRKIERSVRVVAAGRH